MKRLLARLGGAREMIGPIIAIRVLGIPIGLVVADLVGQQWPGLASAVPRVAILAGVRVVLLAWAVRIRF